MIEGAKKNNNENLMDNGLLTILINSSNNDTVLKIMELNEKKKILFNNLII